MDEVPTNGESWLGSNSGTYSSAVSTQRRSADATRGIVGDLVSNSSDYLSNITTSVNNLTDLAIQQQDLYVDMITGMIQDYSKIGGFIGAAKSLVETVKTARTTYTNQVKEQGRQLASAVNTVIKIGLLENDLVGIGPDGKWQGPTNVTRDPSHPDELTADQVRADADWFKKHYDNWDDIASDMGTLKATAAGTSRLPIKMIDLPHFSAMQSSSLNGLADSLSTAIDGGHTAAEDMSVALRQTIRNYIDNEISSTSEADALFNEYFPS